MFSPAKVLPYSRKLRDTGRNKIEINSKQPTAKNTTTRTIFKTPVLSLDEILSAAHSPLVKLEKRVGGPPPREEDIVYETKLLSCVFTINRFTLFSAISR